jgi:DDE superfamily endonuclease
VGLAGRARLGARPHRRAPSRAARPVHAAASGLPALADPGYDGAGIGICIPVKQPAGGRDLDINTRTRNALLRSLRCLGERGFALLTGRWRTLQHVTASPSRIGDIARAALVLTHFEYGYIK